jgi:hypothetical protein
MSSPLSPAVAADLLAAARAAIEAEVRALPPALARFHPAEGEWCALEVVGHLVEADRRGFAGRIRTMLAEDTPRAVPWDQTEVARARRDCAREPADLLAEFSAVRADGIRLVRGLTARDLPRACEHPKVGTLRVADLLHEWVHHDRNHLRQILANVQAYAWPHMGNAQRWSEPQGP